MKRWMSWWSSDRIAILVGFALTIVSLIGGQAYVEPAIQAATAIDQEIAAKRARMMIIDDAVALDDAQAVVVEIAQFHVRPPCVTFSNPSFSRATVPLLHGTFA